MFDLGMARKACAPPGRAMFFIGWRSEKNFISSDNCLYERSGAAMSYHCLTTVLALYKLTTPKTVS